MGLCHENVPDGFQSRYVVPISKATGKSLNCAWISHLPNNYANDPKSDFGKIRMDSLFLNSGESVSDGQAAIAEEGFRTRTVDANGKVKQTAQHRIERYLALPNKVVEGLRWRLGLKR